MVKAFTDNGKPRETGRRKARGPVKWQPATEEEVFLFADDAVNRIIANIPPIKANRLERAGRKARGPVKWQPATEGSVNVEKNI